MATSDCEVSPDRAWSGQWHCSTHSVWFRDDNEPECCPAGEAYAAGKRVGAAEDAEQRALRDWLTSQYEDHIDNATDHDQGSARWASHCAKAEAYLSVLDWIAKRAGADDYE